MPKISCAGGLKRAVLDEDVDLEHLKEKANNMEVK